MMKTEEILEERGKTHGPYSSQACLAQGIKKEMQCFSGWKSLNAPQRDALEMIAVKISRIICGNGDFKDHWDDIAGYAKLVADLCP